MKMEVEIGEVLPETKEYLELPEARRGKKELFLPTDFQRSKSHKYLDF